MLREITRLLIKTTILCLRDISEEHGAMSYDEIYEEVSEGLAHKKAIDGYVQLINNYLGKKPAKWPQHVSRDCLRGLVKSLETYKGHATKYKFVLGEPLPAANAFKEEKKDDAHDLTAIQRLRKFGKTNISYDWYLRYGTEKILNDLKDCGIKNPSIHIAEDSHEPLELVKEVCSENYGEYAFFIPIMPLVIISNGR